MGPWMLACDWIITRARRRLVAGVQLDWTRRILPPTRRILVSVKSSAANAGLMNRSDIRMREYLCRRRQKYEPGLLRPCSHCYSGTVIRHKFVPAQLCRHIGAHIEKSYVGWKLTSGHNYFADIVREMASQTVMWCAGQVASNNDHHRRRIVLHLSWCRRAPVICCQRFRIFFLVIECTMHYHFGPRRC